MKTSTQLLPAINELYSLKLSDNDLDLLKGKISNLKNDLADVEDISPSLWRIAFVLRRGLGIYAVRGNIANDVEVERVSPENEGRVAQIDGMIADGTHFFKYTLDYSQHRKNYCLKLKIVQKEDIAKLQSLTSILESCDSVFKSQIETLLKDTYDTYASFEAALTKVLKEKTELLSMEGRGEDTELFTNFLKSIFPEAVVTEVPDLQETVFKLRQANCSLLQVITHRFEFDNKRVCVNSQFGRYSRSATSIRVVDVASNAYNYADVGRFFLDEDEARYAYSETSNKRLGKVLGNVVFSGDNVVLPKESALQYIATQHRGDETAILDSNAIRMFVKRIAQQEARKNADTLREQALEAKIEKKINILGTTTGKLKLNNVLFENDTITYVDQTLKLNNDTNWVQSLVKGILFRWNLNDVNYDAVFDAFIVKASDGLTRSGIIGSVSFDLSVVNATNSRGITSKRYYINGYRINRDELQASLGRAICFDTQDDFNYFLESVSKCSLKVHKYLQLGLDINVRDSFEGCQCIMKLPLERRKNINYLVLSDMEFRIKDTNKVLSLQNKHDLLEVITVLLDGKAIEGIEPEDIKGIIKGAKQAFITAVNKSKELLKETEDLFKIKVSTVTLDSGEERNGYIIKGKMNSYLLEFNDKEDERAGVYTYPAGKYICIVDKSTSQVGMDKLVNRIYALHNDSLVASQINTLT